MHIKLVGNNGRKKVNQLHSVISNWEIIGVWDARKQKLYGDDSCPSQIKSLAEDLQLAGVEGQMDGKLCSSGEVCTYMCGSAHDCRCNG